MYIYAPSPEWANCPGRSGDWCPLTLPGTTVSGTPYLTAKSTLTLTSSTLSNLNAGAHYLAKWDWIWDATNQCYKGPGATSCYTAANPGLWRLQMFTVQ